VILLENFHKIGERCLVGRATQFPHLCASGCASCVSTSATGKIRREYAIQQNFSWALNRAFYNWQKKNNKTVSMDLAKNSCYTSFNK